VDQLGRAFEKQLEKGQYKTEPNSPTRPDSLVHEYCPPEQVASEMDRLVAMHSEHDERGVPVEVEAAWFHHRFTQIHPFADGNGRVARAIASLVFIKAR
jgi:Fic family protein